MTETTAGDGTASAFPEVRNAAAAFGGTVTCPKCATAMTERLPCPLCYPPGYHVSAEDNERRFEITAMAPGVAPVSGEIAEADGVLTRLCRSCEARVPLNQTHDCGVTRKEFDVLRDELKELTGVVRGLLDGIADQRMHDGYPETGYAGLYEVSVKLAAIQARP